MDLREQSVLGNSAGAHWYYRAKAAAMLRLLRGCRLDSVLDIGAGDGYFSRVLLERTACAAAFCIDPHYADDHAACIGGKPVRFLRAAPDFSGSLVLMMDVLEHVADDAALLRDSVARCRPGTRVLITVPAMPWLWSGHDEFLGHYRRYTLPGLRRLIEAAGLRPLRLCHYFGLVLPIAATLRLQRRWRGQAPRSDLRVHGAVVNRLLWRLCQAELPVFPANRLAGLSVFALCARGEE